MVFTIHDNKIFEGINYSEKVVTGMEFHGCTFKKCELSNSKFANNKFLDCIFDNCNLSMMSLQGSIIHDIKFKNCKILGVNFSECHSMLFSVLFEGCILDYASFMGKKMTKTRFGKTSLKETTFSQANIAGSVFDQCDLYGTVFNRTDLSGVNFSTSFNYTIDPEINNIKKAIFSADGVRGLLSKYQIKIID